METATRETYEVDQSVGDRAEAWYNAGLRRKLETRANLGKYLMINPETGDYVMGTDPHADDALETSREARARFGTNRLFGIRIGYPTVAAIGATLTPYEHLLGDNETTGEQRRS